MEKTAIFWFDGQVLRPEEPVEMEPNRRYTVTYRPTAPVQAAQEDAWDVLEQLAGTIDAPPDWSEEHDHYIRGGPKKFAKGGGDDPGAGG